MILYNITVNIDPEVEDNWVNWMKNTHIPNVMETGLFFDNRFFKLLNELPEIEGVTYSVQYFAEDMNQLNEYQTHHAERLQKEHHEAFKDRFVAFRTYLESV
jgi:hypothetical protein